MERLVFEKYDGNSVTDQMLQEASQLFSKHYGVWDERAAQTVGKFAKAGSHIRLSKERLRTDYAPNSSSAYVRVAVNGRLAGHVFACRWTHDGKRVCWITQLVVHREYRERGLAVGLLSLLRQDGDDVYGIMSSHPAACLAAAKALGTGSINSVRVDFIKESAEAGIMKASPIGYVRDAKLRGSLFDPEDLGGLVASVDTDFWVDHTEPLEALAWVRKTTDWPLGELHDGHEFLLILEARRRVRPTSRSRSELEALS